MMKIIVTQAEINAITSICTKYNIINYTINNDGTIDVDGDVIITSSKITKLPIIFNHVRGSFYLYDNNKLNTLLGAPKNVDGVFVCSKCNLQSLKYFPIEVGKMIDCSLNRITSLEYLPSNINGNFYCYNNKLSTLEHCPSKINGDFSCEHNYLHNLVGMGQVVGKVFAAINNFGPYFSTMVQDLKPDELDILFKYSNYYEIWKPKLDLNSLNDLIFDIKEGLE